MSRWIKWGAFALALAAGGTVFAWQRMSSCPVTPDCPCTHGQADNK